MRFALRQLIKSPAFTVVAVLSLALGIGANTAIFSFVNDFLLRSLPVRAPEELVIFRYVASENGNLSRSESGNSGKDPATGRRTGTSFSLLTFERFRAQHPALSHVFAFTPLYQSNVLIDGQPETAASTQLVSGDYYAGLGVSAILGRPITAEDDQPSAPVVAVISERYWQTRFAGDRSVLGRTIHVNKVPATIIGVSAPGFNGTGQAGESYAISLPLAHAGGFDANPDKLKGWYWWVRLMGRLAPGFTAEQARGSLEPILQEATLEGWKSGQSMDRTPQTPAKPPTLVADPGAQGENDTRRYYAQSMRILMGIVGLVLLAACANVANLLLARGAARRREIAVRLALGASRGRIVRQLLLESLLLAGLGAALGTLLAWWSRGLLLALRPFGFDLTLDLPLDGRVLGFTIAAAFGTAILFGLAPALRATRPNLTSEFQGGARTLGGGGRSRLAQTLMVVQIALSLVLLVSTALFVRTLRNLQSVPAGFNRAQLVQFRVDVTPAGYKDEQELAVQLRLLERFQQIPGVSDATFTSVPLLNRGRWNGSVNIPGFTPPTGTTAPMTNFNAIAPNFFSALQLPLVLGRSFDERDGAKAPKVAIANQAFVRTFMSEGGSPVGRRFGMGRGQPVYEIVGVAADAKYTSLRDAVVPTVYLPMAQSGGGSANFLVRASGDLAAVLPALRTAAREIDATLPLQNLRTLDEQLERNAAQERLFAKLSGFFGLLALALACVGLYGLMSYTVLRRTGEIGLRMALGAVPAQVLRMILKESLALVCLGVVLGLTGAWFASKSIAGMLFGLSATDPFTYALAACVLIGVALVAALLPARRAARTDPMTALRTE